MSAKVAKRVLDSDLPPHLKFPAVVLALYGDEDGASIFPSVERVAYDLSLNPRTVRRALSELRRLGLLVPHAEPRGGRRVGGGPRTTVYRLDQDALPVRAPTTRTPASGFGRCQP